MVLLATPPPPPSRYIGLLSCCSCSSRAEHFPANITTVTAFRFTSTTSDFRKYCCCYCVQSHFNYFGFPQILLLLLRSESLQLLRTSANIAAVTTFSHFNYFGLPQILHCCCIQIHLNYFGLQLQQFTTSSTTMMTTIARQTFEYSYYISSCYVFSALFSCSVCSSPVLCALLCSPPVLCALPCSNVLLLFCVLCPALMFSSCSVCSALF